ncbi:MAG: aldose 1-epimerase family protein [Salinivirgaceae bacterium]|jgi:galactose mutarotase-like enzyme|nr:aldose 1-epimerase family protein [Salinivirgaceae bacterium]
MKHSISNDYLHVSVLGKGTEISSIKSTKTGREYMWDANPEVWGSHAPVLFPAIGSFKNDKCTINGTAYKIPKHGFVRNNEAIVLKKRTSDRLNFQLDYSEQTLQIFPYKFQFNISFQLIGTKLLIAHRVENLDSKEMFFSLGAHPGFKCPVNEGEAYEDYYLEFEKEENATTTLLSENGLITDKTKQVLTDTRILPLHSELFSKDALIFKKLKSRKVSLKSHKSDQVLTLSYSDFSYLGIWAKPNAPFVCIEPWLGIADHENTDGDYLKKEGLISLAIGEVFKAQYSIEIDDY